jgi:hypothetical protein
MLYHRGVAPQEQPFTGLINADRLVVGFINATASPRFLTDASWYRRCLAELRQADPVVAGARLGHLLQACLDLSVPGLGAWLITELAPPLPRQLVHRWGKELGGPQTIRATIEGVWWHEDPEVQDNLKARIADTIGEFAARLSTADRHEWFLQVDEQLAQEQHTAWTRLAGYEVAKPHRGRRGRARDS